MREIKFRGKRKDDGEWVYGYYCEVEGMHIIIPCFKNSNTNVRPFLDFAEDMPDVISGWFEVIPETVGRFTSLKDKNGKDLDWWEDDVIEAPNGKRVVIRYRESEGAYYVYDSDNKPLTQANLIAHWGWKKVGNIHENPELEAKE